MISWRCRSARLFTLSVILTIIIFSFSAVSCSSKRYSGKVEPITIGAQLLEASTPILIAQSQGFFQQNGLDVTFKSYDTGLNALNGMINGEVDIATTVSDYAVVNKLFAKPSIGIVGSLARMDDLSIVARKDRGIGNVSDLKGKKVGMIAKTNLEFFLGRLLELNAMNPGDVTFVDT